MVEEEEETEIPPGNFIGWEAIHCPRSLHDQSLLLTDPSLNGNGWSMVAIRDSSRYDHHRSIAFPPVNHEGLRIDPENDKSSLSSSMSDLNQENDELPSLSDVNRVDPPPPQPQPSSQAVGDSARWWDVGIEVLRSRVTGIASSLRRFASTRGLPWSFYSPAGAAAVVLLVLLYLRVRRQRQLRTRKQSVDHLILLLKEKDERINQLLHQIARMNEVLLGLHGVPVPKTG